MRIRKSDLQRIGRGFEHKNKTSFVVQQDSAGIAGIFLREALEPMGYCITQESESVLDDSIIFDTDLPYDVFAACVPANDVLAGLGSFCYGTRPSEHNPRVPVKDYHEIAIIDTIKQRFKEGDSLRAIARWLNGEGLFTRKGTEWHATQIARILDRENRATSLRN